MDRKKITFAIFILVALGQLYVPAKMIMDREEILQKGKSFYFKATPVDPTDPFRGKYITLNFEASRVKTTDQHDWVNGEPVYLLLATDAEGFARVQDVASTQPTDTTDFLAAVVDYTTSDALVVELPFDRFYMEESKAPEAERTYNRTMLDTAKVTYALVKVKSGQAVLADVLIDGVPIREVVKAGL